MTIVGMLLDAFLDQVRGLVPPARQLMLRRIRDLIRVSVTDGADTAEYGGRLAPETELMADYGGTRDVVREALSQLSDEGLLERRRGLGTLRTVDRVSWDIQLPAMGDSLKQHLAVGRISPKLLHWGWIKAPSLIASKLDGVAPGDNCLCIDYVLMRDGVPSAVITNYLRDPAARTELLQTLAGTVDKGAPWLDVVNDRNPRAFSPSVTGFTAPQSWFIDLTTVSVD